MDKLALILVIVYMILGYWAMGKTIYADKIRIGTWQNLFIQRVMFGTLLGIIIIPIAIIKTARGR